MRRPQLSHKQKALMKACENNDVKKCKEILKKEIDLNFSRENMRSPLQQAIFHGSLEVTRLLLEYGADSNSVEGDSSCHLRTPIIMEAIERNETEIVKLLLDFGADPNAKDGYGRSPLQHAVTENCNPAVIELLLKFGADINGLGDQLESPLHDFPSVSTMLESFLRWGADVDCVNVDGESVLTKGFDEKDVECITLLLKWGSDPNHKDTTDYSCLHMLCSSDFDRFQTIAKVLVAFNADKDIKSKHGCPVKYCIKKKRVEQLEFLLEGGATMQGEDPLQFAMGYYENKGKVVRSLMNYYEQTERNPKRRKIN